MNSDVKMEIIQEEIVPTEKQNQSLKKLLNKKTLLIKSCVLVAIIVLVLVWFFVIPHMQEVTFIFKSDNIQLVESFDFSVNVNGNTFDGKAVKGKAILELPEAEIQINSVALKDYKLIQNSFEFSQTLVVNLERIYSNEPRAIYLYKSDGSLLNKEANLSFDCSIAEYSEQKSTNNGTLNLEVPENCGELSITTQIDDYKVIKGEKCDKTTCSLVFDPITKTDVNGNTSLPTGKLRVYTYDNSGLLPNVNIDIYNSQDLKNKIDFAKTNSLGYTREFSLIVGNYNIYTEETGYISTNQDIVIEQDKLTDLNITLKKQTLGSLELNFNDAQNNPTIKGSLILKDSQGKIAFKDKVINGTINLPIYFYGEFYLDFEPDANNLFPIANEKLMLTSNSVPQTYKLVEKTQFNTTKLIIKVTDEDNNPVENCKVFVQDMITQFELLSFTIPNTDSNGTTSVVLPEGAYRFRAYNNYNEAFSNGTNVSVQESGNQPELSVEIKLAFGYATLKTTINDEFKSAKANAEIAFYKKPKAYTGTNVTDKYGQVTHPFKAGSPLYYVVKADNYLPYYSESRLLMTNMIWDSNLQLVPKAQEESKVDFLGLYGSLGDEEESKTASIGGTYYLGFRIYAYTQQKNMIFTINVGEYNVLDQEKLFLIEGYTSANTDIKYLDSLKSQLSFGNAKVISSEWQNPTEGIYDIYYKVQIKNNSSVQLFDSLKISWDLDLQDKKLKGIKNFIVGSETLCPDNDFCSRFALLDKTTNLYIDALKNNGFSVVPGHTYEFKFDIINGIKGLQSDIKNGKLQIYNASSQDEGFDSVKNKISDSSFLHLYSYSLKGPEENNSVEMFKDLFGIFELNYVFTNYLENKYISGMLTFSPTVAGQSFINFLITDLDRHIIVNGKPALSLLLETVSSKKINVGVFPNKLLAPNSQQKIIVSASDDSNSILKDALVSVKIKKPEDLQYYIYSECNSLLTDLQGNAICDLEPLPPGTYVQVLVEKEGYEGYSQLGFSPDLQVTTNIFGFDKDILKVGLIYPTVNEQYDSLVLINHTGTEITLDHVDLEIDNYTFSSSGFLNIDEMKNYLQAYSNKTITGLDPDYINSDLPNEAKTELKNIFKAVLNTNTVKEINTEKKVTGKLILFFKTDNEQFTRAVPFEVNIVSQGYPTNAEDCLAIGLNTDKLEFATESSKPINIPVLVQNNCVISYTDTKGLVEPLSVKFDSVYLVLKHNSGALGLGDYSFVLNSGESVNLTHSVPKVFATDWQSDLDNVIKYGQIVFTPKGMNGKENLSIKLIGLINTSEGIKKVESKEEKFDLSVLNIEDCVKIFDDKGKEIDELTFGPRDLNETHGANLNKLDTFELTFKNICLGIPLDIILCKGNSQKISEGCGDDTLQKEYAGFFFDSAQKSKTFSLTDEKKIEITRPKISGAYALEIYAKQPNENSYKRVKILKTNVQTAYGNTFFMPNPFLEVFTEKENGTYKTDVLNVYNTDVPSSMKIIDRNNFYRVLDQPENSLINLTSAANLLAQGVDYSSTSGAGGIEGMKAEFGLGINLVVVGAAMFVVPAIGWIVGTIMEVVGVILLALSCQTHLDQAQISKYLSLKGEDIEIIPVSGDIVEIMPNGTTNYNTIFRITGQDHYEYNIVAEHITGFVGGVSSTSWDNSIKFDVMCSSSDYEVDKENILVLNKGEPHTKFSHCWWNSDPTISGNIVTFYPKCEGAWVEELVLNSYVVVPCKLKSELWARALQKGISGDYYNVGLFKLQFNNLDFNKMYDDKPCNIEWCYKTYPLEINGGILGNMFGNIRLAFHNPQKIEEINNVIGKPCTDIKGNIIGFTGSDAKPKLQYKWDKSIDENFCSPDVEWNVKQYCDATQFFISGLQRLKNAKDKISKLNLQCQSLDPTHDYENSANANDDYYNELKVSVNKEETEFYLQAKKDLGFFPKETDTKYRAVVTYDNKAYDANVDKQFVPLLDKVREYILVTLKLGAIDVNNSPAGHNVLFDKDLEILLTKCDSDNCSLLHKNKVHAKSDLVVFKGGCVLKYPSTDVLPDGKMKLSKFLSKDFDQKELFEIQDILHYNAYLMDDGYSQNFLQDFLAQTDSFLNDFKELVLDLDLKTKIEEKRFKILNEFDNEPKANGPGLYGIHFIVGYSQNSNDFKDANVIVQISKVKSALNNNVFYYLPIDGLVGISESTINRQGYGIDFGQNSDVVEINKFTTDQQLLSDLETTSNPKSTLNITKSLSFAKLNSLSSRGTVLDAKLSKAPTNIISIGFIPDLAIWKAEAKMKNKQIDSPVSLFYEIIYNGESQIAESSLLPWFVSKESYEKTDFTGQKLFDTYPKVAVQSLSEDNVSNKASKIEYTKEAVTDLADYNIYSYIYAPSNASVLIEDVKTVNLENPNIKNKTKEFGIENLNSVLEGIDSNLLCISGNELSTRVFVNEPH